MSQSKVKVELIDPREHGQRALDITPPVFDERAIARAEAVLQEMSADFPKWLEDDMARIQELRHAADANGWSDQAQDALHNAAHDLKGLGATYGFPIVTSIAASLCRLIETLDGKMAARRAPALAHAHVDALRAVVRSGVRNADHPVGLALLRELEAQVAELTVATR